jgi:hypothetical protein
MFYKKQSAMYLTRSVCMKLFMRPRKNLDPLIIFALRNYQHLLLFCISTSDVKTGKYQIYLKERRGFFLFQKLQSMCLHELK